MSRTAPGPSSARRAPDAGATAGPGPGTATVVDAMDHAAVVHGDVEAYVEGDRRITFGEWMRSAEAVAAELVDRGIRPGDVVALALPSSIDYAIAYAAVVRAGAVATGVNLRLGPREITAIFDRCQPRLVVIDAERPVPVGAGVPVLARSELASISRRSPLGDRAGRPTPSDPAVIIWTSGTTGVPKGAWFDHANLAAAVAAAGVLSAPGDRQLAATPFPHAGYMFKLWAQLASGTTLVISPAPWDAEQTLRLLVEERITVAAAVPTQWAKLVDLPGLARADLSHLRIGVSATAPCPPALARAVASRIGCPLVVRYAMTEAPSITGTEPDDPPEVQYSTVGRPQAGMEVRILADDGFPAGPGHVGAVEVRGRCVMRGYWRDPERTAACLSDEGWLRTGDRGMLTADGNLVLVGRATDMYIRGGYNVHPVEVERVLAEHPAVGQVAVVGHPAPVIGEIGVAFVVPSRPTSPPTLDELRTFVAGTLADYKAPDRLVVLESLPLTAMAKVDRQALRSLLEAPEPVDGTGP
jgi:acyl-CoA synthetase (AMP-forming)/AMP-acid ligase II